MSTGTGGYFNETNKLPAASAPYAKLITRHTLNSLGRNIYDIRRATVTGQGSDPTTIRMSPNGGCGASTTADVPVILGLDTQAMIDSYGLPILGGPSEPGPGNLFTQNIGPNGVAATLGFRSAKGLARKLPFLSGLTAKRGVRLLKYGDYDYVDENNVTHVAPGSPDPVVSKPQVQINPAVISGVDLSSIALTAGDDGEGAQVKIDGTTVLRDPTTGVLSAVGLTCNTTVDCAYAYGGGTPGTVRTTLMHPESLFGGDIQPWSFQIGTTNTNNDGGGIGSTFYSGHANDNTFKPLFSIDVERGGSWAGYTGDMVNVLIDGDLFASGNVQLAQGSHGASPFISAPNFVNIHGYLNVGGGLSPAIGAGFYNQIFNSTIFVGDVQFDRNVDMTGAAVSTGALTSGAITSTGASTFTPDAANKVPVSILPHAGQTADLFQVGVSGGAFRIQPNGATTIGGHVTAPSLHITDTSTFTNEGRTDHAAMTAPATPAAGYTSLYSRTVTGLTKLYFKDDAGTEHDLSAGSGGTVTSVDMSVPAALLSVSGNPVTTAGTLALSLPTRAANLVFAGPSSGGAATPAFRSLVAADIPDLSATYQTVGGTGGTGGDHLHGLARWVAGGGTTFNLPDLAEYAEMVFDNGSAVDSATVTLSADRTQIIFDSAPTAGHVLQAEYVIARI